MTTAHGTSSQYGCALFSGERPEFSLSVWKKKKKNKTKKNKTPIHCIRESYLEGFTFSLVPGCRIRSP